MVLPDSAGNRFELPVIGHQSAGVVRVGDRFGGIRVDRFRFISPQQLLQLFVVVPVGDGPRSLRFLLLVARFPLPQPLKEGMSPTVFRAPAVATNSVAFNRQLGSKTACKNASLHTDVQLPALAVAAARPTLGAESPPGHRVTVPAPRHCAAAQ